MVSRQEEQQLAPLPTRLTARDLKLIRQVRQLRQVDVAKRAGFSISKLSNLEAGKEPITPAYEVALIRALFP